MSISSQPFRAEDFIKRNDFPSFFPLFFFTAENVSLCSIVAANRQMYLDYHSQCLNISCLQYCHLPFIQIYRTDREKTKN